MTSTMHAAAPAASRDDVPSAQREEVACYLCGGTVVAEVCRVNDDLTGKPGDFTFVACAGCTLVYQQPRIPLDGIKAFYSDEYIAHRRKTQWGPLTGLYAWGMGKHDRDKVALVRRYAACDRATQVLDVGCGAGTFLALMQARYGCAISGVDFVDLSRYPAFADANFYHGVLCDQNIAEGQFDVITMWHFLEHDYDPIATLQAARRLLKPQGVLIIEVPRLDSWTHAMYQERWPGWQAPQHTVAYTKRTLFQAVRKADLRVEEHLAYGAFPAYFYLFAGAAFKVLKGKGLNLSKAIYPYFAGQLLMSPALLFEKHLNLAMQTVVCTRGDA